MLLQNKLRLRLGGGGAAGISGGPATREPPASSVWASVSHFLPALTARRRFKALCVQQGSVWKRLRPGEAVRRGQMDGEGMRGARRRAERAEDAEEEEGEVGVSALMKGSSCSG